MAKPVSAAPWAGWDTSTVSTFPVRRCQGLRVLLVLSQTASPPLLNLGVESWALLIPQVHIAYSLTPRNTLDLKGDYIVRDYRLEDQDPHVLKPGHQLLA